MIFLIHGAYGHPEENWFPWLKAKLEELGHEVVIPEFPTPEGQTLENWLDVMPKTDDDTIFIGHSIGVAFILKYLETHKAKAAFLVAGFCSQLGNEFDKVNKTFLEDFDWDKIRKNCKDFIVFSSDNDPYVDLDKGAELAASLRSELILLKNAGHVNADSGYTSFPELLEKIKSI